MKIKKKNWGGGGEGQVGVVGLGGGQVECERRIEVFVKIQKRIFFRGVGVGSEGGGACWGWSG